MGKFDFNVAVLFATQTAEGTYNSALDSLSGAVATSNGLLLGSPVGVGESGLTFGIGRRFTEGSVVGAGFTKAISDFLAEEIPTFTFAHPWIGNRATTGATPVDGEFVPNPGLDALLEGVGMSGAVWGSGVGYSYKFATPYPNPISALVFYSGNRLELLDCRASVSIAFQGGEVPVATWTIAVGSVKEHVAEAFPTVNYTNQASVSAIPVKLPTPNSERHIWDQFRGFSAWNLAITPNVVDVPDSNAAQGIVKEVDGRESKVTATLFADDTTNAIYDQEQIVAALSSDLDQISWQLGDTNTGSEPARAIRHVAPNPELQVSNVAKLGSKFGTDVEVVLREDAVNEELELIFL